MKDISLNFGALRDSIYNFTTKELIKNESKGNETMKKFLKEIKENPVLKIQYLIFKNIENGKFKKERLAERYINQNLKLLENISWETLLKTNKKTRETLLKDYHVSGKTDKLNELYENIHILIESTIKGNYFDIGCSQNAYEFVLNYLLREDVKPEEVLEENDMPKFFSTKYITELAVSNFNKRYAHLNESERNLLKVLLSTQENKVNYLDGIISESLQLINSLYEEENTSEEIKSSLKLFEEKIKNLPETDEKNIDEIIINCAELNETLKEL